MLYDHERFLSNWKVHDKVWMNNRKQSWKNIQLQLDRLKSCYLLSGIKKSNYKYFKHYFLTGKDTDSTADNIAFRCLGLYGLDHNDQLFVQFWLSADHSSECLEYLKNKLSERYNYDYFWGACTFYRRSAKCYPAYGKYGWNENEGTTEKNGQIFGDLEPKMLSLFAYTPEEEAKFDERMNYERGSTVQAGFEGVFVGYFGGLREEPNDSGFNPNNPIKNMINEYMRWGFPKHRGHDDCLGFNIAMSLIWYVTETPEGRHSLQLEMANNLRDRISNQVNSMSEETQDRFEMAMEFYNSGEYKQFLEEK